MASRDLRRASSVRSCKSGASARANISASPASRLSRVTMDGDGVNGVDAGMSANGKEDMDCLSVGPRDREGRSNGRLTAARRPRLRSGRRRQIHLRFRGKNRSSIRPR